MAAVVTVNLTIDKGTTFDETFFFTNDDGTILNLSNTNITAKIKKHSASKIFYSFSVTCTLNLGAITISMAPEVTASLPSGRCVYDVVLQSSNGKKRKLVEGNIIVRDSVSL